MTYAEFKQNFLGDFLNIKSFAGRMKYASQYLTRIGSGSGRIVYDIDGERVLKLAKNPKGVAQNEAEANAGRYDDTHSIVTKVFEEADDSTWLISEKGKKVTERRIKELTGIPNLNDVYHYLRNFHDANNGRRTNFKLDDNTYEILIENEFVQELENFMANYSQSPGDFGRPSSYGEVLRDGQPTIVLTDYGLNDEVYDTHYSPKRKQQYQMYEMYNCADGNDDILSDIDSGEQTRRGMLALMPYGVGDGDEPMNEEFISYVENRNKYPNKRLPNLPFLTDRFHECVNNLKETLNVVKNKKQFYNNLLELQDYLIEQKYYDREPLNHEEYVINEANVPAVQMFTLEDKNYAKQLAILLAKKLNLTTPKYIGGGANGFAFEINNNLVMKLTADISEADAASNLLRGRPKYIAIVFNLYKIVDTETNMAYYAIMEENINDKPLERFRKFDQDIVKISVDGQGLNNFYRLMKNSKTFNYNSIAEQAKEILTENPEAGISEADRRAAYEYVIGLLNIKKELIEFDIKSMDYIEIKNLGYKNGVLKFFDFGGRMAGTEPDMKDNDIVYLPEDSTSKFSTIDSVGRDDFPVYDNNDTSPLTDNNVPTSVEEIVERIVTSMKGKALGDMQKSMLIKIYADKVRNNREELLSLVNQPKGVEEGYPIYGSFEKPYTWKVGAKDVDVNFFVEEYDKWNHQSEIIRFTNPSRESVLRFLEDEYENLVNDEKLKRELNWELNLRDLLNEDIKRNVRIMLNENNDFHFTEEDLDSCWKYHKSYLIDILNGEYDLNTAREDLRGSLGSEFDERNSHRSKILTDTNIAYVK